MPKISLFRIIWIVFRKDMMIEWHTRDILSAMGLFAVLILVIFNFTLDYWSMEYEAYSSGVIWITIIYSSTLGINRLMSVEQENQVLSAESLLPADKGGIFLGKSFSALCMVGMLELIILPLFSLFFNGSIGETWAELLFILFLGTTGYVGAGTLIGTIALSAKMKEMLMPLLLLPVSIPLIIASVEATRTVQKTKSLGACQDFILLLIAYDILIYVISFLLYEYILEE